MVCLIVWLMVFFFVCKGKKTEPICFEEFFFFFLTFVEKSMCHIGLKQMSKTVDLLC